ncbi:MAG: methionyl-tRNA formyltransferase [Candidatus Omnitrophica bacterium]|nr:methionyl-tRNA formyltransferase [Candidatus Omnitrophota bacterium]MCF7878109.1 methionyl-tRNA formyltransferase [Candidatus Omnitrophota bacterium]MCF7892987.1 methionyl-tRNA formyltransferase [Candidatus Omnitrophota bacterium]
MDKIIYFGSSNFSKIVLETLLEAKVRPLLVVTKPDAPKGRGLKLYQTQLAETAQNNNIELIKPDNLKKANFLDKISALNPDYLVVADYGKIIPTLLLSMPKTLPLGIHPSLLPLYRGPAPIERTLLEGRQLTGVTIFKLDKGIDTGPILLQKKIKVDANDTYFTLLKKLAVQGAETLIESLYQTKDAPANLKPQDDKKATFAPKLTKQTGKINWNNSAAEIKNLIRATLNWPAAYTYYKNKVLKITEADTAQDKNNLNYKQPAIISKINKDGICVTTGSGILKIRKLKPEGKKEMPAWSFVCGHRVKEGDRFEL